MEIGKGSCQWSDPKGNIWGEISKEVRDRVKENREEY